MRRQQHPRHSKRAAPASPLPRRRSLHRDCRSASVAAWKESNDEQPTQPQHVIHLHPAGPTYSSDEAGDGPQPPSPATLSQCFLPLLAQQEHPSHATVHLNISEPTLDHTPAALRRIRATLLARASTLSHLDLQHLLEHELTVTISHRMLQQSFHNTPARGYCGYIVVLQAVLLHLYSWTAYPDLTDPLWRHALATLLDMACLSTAVIPPAQADEHPSLMRKMPIISPRLRASAADNGTLDSAYWLSSDEVMCALTLLSIPSTMWIHSDSMRIHNDLPQHSLILAQSAPECTLPLPLHAPPSDRLCSLSLLPPASSNTSPCRCSPHH